MVERVEGCPNLCGVRATKTECWGFLEHANDTCEMQKVENHRCGNDIESISKNCFTDGCRKFFTIDLATTKRCSLQLLLHKKFHKLDMKRFIPFFLWNKFQKSFTNSCHLSKP